MSRINRWVGGATLALASFAAAAGTHQICYEGAPQPQGGSFISTGVYGCAVDGGGRCVIRPLTADMRARASAAPLDAAVQVAGATFAYYDFKYSTGVSYGATFEFYDASGARLPDRQCSVVPLGWVGGSQGGAASRGAVLTGFSTDASGLATTGVWRLQATTDAPWRLLEVVVPADFVAVGGGAMGVETPAGALLTDSRRNGGVPARSWTAGTSEASNVAQPHRTTAYVVGLHVEGLPAATLAGWVTSATASSGVTPLAHPAAEAQQPVIGGSVVVGGEFVARADLTNSTSLRGQFATSSAPVVGPILRCVQLPSGVISCGSTVLAITGWAAESKDHVVAHPGSIGAGLLALPTTITVGGTAWEVRSRLVSATSAVAAHPSIDVGGLRGEYAVTGIGATVNWKRFDAFGAQIAAGNLLWKLEPRADLGGASVASKDHVIGSPASITGFALGIKLVAPGTP